MADNKNIRSYIRPITSNITRSIVRSMARAGVVSAAFSPLSIEGLKVWLDPSDDATITESGGEVSQINDKSGNNYHAIQSTSGKYPLISAGEFGSRKGLMPNELKTSFMTINDLTVTGGMTAFFVMRNERIYPETLNKIDTLIYLPTPNGILSSFNGYQEGNDYPYIRQENIAGAKLFVDIEEIADNTIINANTNYVVELYTTASFTNEDVQILNKSPNAFGHTGPVGTILIFEGRPSLSQRIAIYEWLSSLYGTSIQTIETPSWEFTKTGVIQGIPTQMATNVGPYYPCIVDMSGVESFPADFALYYSTDHDGVGEDGIYLSICTGDPSIAANWKSYDQAVSEGDFDYLSSKPASNPIYRDTFAGHQTETPCVQVIGDDIVLTYHNDKVGTTQSTIRALSTDGINFTRDDIILDYTTGSAVGDGHTGYFIWGPNPFIEQPYDYVGYSLHGGGATPHFALWGTNNPVSGSWEKLAIQIRDSGRVLDKYNNRVTEWNAFNVNTARTHGDGSVSILGTFTTGSFAGGSRNQEIYEIVMSADGTQIVKDPILVLNRTSGGADAYEAAIPNIVRYGGTDILIYNATNASGYNSIAAATDSGGLRNKANFFDLSPAIPETLITNNFISFPLSQDIPAWLEIVKSSVGDSVTYDASGARLNTSSGEEVYIYAVDGFIPDNVDYIEFFVQDISTITSTANRIPLLGFAESKSIEASWTDAIWLDNNTNTNGIYFNERISGSDQSPESLNDLGWGYGTSYIADAPKEFGFRWFPSDGRLFALSNSSQEFAEIPLQVTFDTSKTYYPVFGIKAVGSSIEEVLGKITLKIG